MRFRPAEGSTRIARKLRSNPTDAETTMWALLRKSFPEARFRRQVPLRNFIADFASHRSMLVIEVDGGQHEGGTDAGRSALIEAEGYRVLRFWNHEVLGNPDGVWTVIREALLAGHPHPALPHQGGGDKAS